MASTIYYFQLKENEKYVLPEHLLSHCKKEESKAAAKALLDMGVKNLYYEENGKPNADNCFVSISHSEKIVAVCKSDMPVGIDVEVFGRSRDFTKIANRYFSKAELDYYNAYPDEKTFLEIWTKKEAYSKISGNGISDIINKVDVLSLDGYGFETDIVDNFVVTLCEKII